MYIESFSGPATKRETDSFYRHIAQFQPSDDNIGNAWVQGDSGEAVKAIGLIYQFTFSVFLLNQMIRFCDKLLSIRNDIAPFPVGQHKIWTGYVDAVWPNKIDRTIRMTGGEQGDAAGHLAYCARLLLANETLRDEPLDYGDPYWFGRTYGERANKYLKEAERTVVNHILNNLVNLTNGKYYFSKDSPYKGQRAVPWNQQMMFNYVFQHMSVAFGMLGDTEKAMKYKTIVTRNVRWFFDEAELYENHKGSHCYRLPYNRII